MGLEGNTICLLFPEPGIAEGFPRAGKDQDMNLMIWATNKKQRIGGGTAYHQRVQRLDAQPSGDQKSWSCEDVRINIDTKQMNNQLILPF